MPLPPPPPILSFLVELNVLLFYFLQQFLSYNDFNTSQRGNILEQRMHAVKDDRAVYFWFS